MCAYNSDYHISFLVCIMLERDRQMIICCTYTSIRELFEEIDEMIHNTGFGFFKKIVYSSSNAPKTKAVISKSFFAYVLCINVNSNTENVKKKIVEI